MSFEALIPIGISLLIAGFNCAMFIVIKFNDMAHMAKAMDELKNLVNGLYSKIDKYGERISTIEGRCEANHKQ